MDRDDQPVGRVLTRREVLKVLGVAGAATLASCAPTPRAETPTGAMPSEPTAIAQPATPGALTPTAQAVTEATSVPSAVPSCVVRPELTEGPFFLGDEPERSDIRSDSASGVLSEGLPLTLEVVVSQIAAGACQSLAGAVVDVWHCDASGVYSGVQGNGANFLRGYQLTDAEGVARFVTVYPGWYPGRAVHIHFKVRAPAAAGTYEFTSQLFFDEAVTAQIYAQAPYASRGLATTSNASDRIFAEPLVLSPSPSGAGYAAWFEIALDLGDTAAGAED
jgi:protocatechuate 3,4-dioxygenase beta subunit